ncbi:DUF6973 domain-containing protein [uncultured Sphingomonas sp.]|uniref:DUF6973 domain-containing protein n=1 Tax=uncultured Sphingomonas sp. TaxID=158754 RepID=UPI0035CC5DD8
MFAVGGLNVGALIGAAVSAAKVDKPLLSAIERTYQVAQDRVETWSAKLFGAIPMGGTGGSRELTATEGKLLDQLTLDRGVVGLQRFKTIAGDAFSVADRRVPPSASMPPEVRRTLDDKPADVRATAIEQWPRNDGHNDAFRHAFWNARLTAEFGENWTKQFATAHEGSNIGNSTREAMDLYNNEVGRRVATENPRATPEQLADLVKQALDAGELVVIGRNGHLNWSDAVANGRHGVSKQLGVADAIRVPAGDASAR